MFEVYLNFLSGPRQIFCDKWQIEFDGVEHVLRTKACGEIKVQARFHLKGVEPCCYADGTAYLSFDTDQGYISIIDRTPC
jgi:hypothetical protein